MRHRFLGSDPLSLSVVCPLGPLLLGGRGPRLARKHPTKVKVTDKQLATVDLHPHRFHGDWNYTIKHQIISV